MAQEKLPDETLTLAKYAGTCTTCGYAIRVNTAIWFNTYKKTVRHKNCPLPYPEIDNATLYDMWVKLGKETARVNEGKNDSN